ncbi:MAG: hypothetical protein HKP38_07690 [Croceitalea sp.]|nr:hypothetical protein [Croceitalea sp.]
MRFKLFFILTFCGMAVALGQIKDEREQRISNSAFPQNALGELRPFLKDVRRLRFYKEQDGKKVSYECKFKKDRLQYSIEYDSLGQLEDLEFIITHNDIPELSWTSISEYLEQNYNMRRIKKIQQQYPYQSGSSIALLKNALQNLLSPNMNYEIVIVSKVEKGFVDYELLFTANGKFINARRVLNSKYDHVLY